MSSLFLMISIFVNLFLWMKNKELKSQLQRLQQRSIMNKPFSHKVRHSVHTVGDEQTISNKAKHSTAAALEAKQSQLSELELELDSEIVLQDISPLKYKVKPDSTEPTHSTVKIPRENALHNVLQLLSGWHKSFIPFLLQNIGWFIGILCFISGSIFLVSYTEGFSKSITIFYTIVSYTLLLGWGGYHLKEKVAHAAMSGMVLLAISFLLVPLNFSAAGRLLSSIFVNSADAGQLIITGLSVLLVSVILFYCSRLISGLYNRQLLHYFSTVFFSISAVQLLIPVVAASQNQLVVLIMYSVIMILLLAALVFYLPVVLQQIYVDKKYLILFSVGSLFFAAIVSLVHTFISSSVTIATAYYAPLMLVISAVLFYMDKQLRSYQQQGGLLSGLTIAAYALSFAALAVSFDSALLRLIIVTLSMFLYARLMWLYRSLVPLYLVIASLCFLYMDSFLINNEWLLSMPLQWLYVSLLPLIMVIYALFSLFRKSTDEQKKTRVLSSHLLHFIIILSVVSAMFGQWAMQMESLSWASCVIVITTLYYLLKSEQVGALRHFGINVYTLYAYVLTLLVVVLLLISQFISIEIKLSALTLLAVVYALNSYYGVLSLSGTDKKAEQEVFINSSLLITLLLLVITVLSFSLSIKLALLLFVLSLNTLFLSIRLYNRALFYVFLLLLSMAVVIIKLLFSDTASSGLLVSSGVFLLFYVIYSLQTYYFKRSAGCEYSSSELETVHANKIHQNAPDKLLWFYPVNDLSVEIVASYEEEAKNV